MITVLVIGAFFAGLYFTSTRKAIIKPLVPPPAKQEPNSIVPPIVISPLPGFSLNTRFEVKLSPSRIPGFLPVYSLAPSPDLLHKVSGLAVILKMTQGPVVSKEVGFDYYTWTGDAGATLSYRTKPPSVSYTINVNPVSPAPQRDAATKAVELFIEKGDLLPKDVKIKPLTVDFYKNSGVNLVPVPSANDATLTGVTFTYYLNDTELFLELTQKGGATALVARGGAVKSLSLRLPFSFVQKNVVPLVPLSAATDALGNNRGALVEFKNGFIEETTPAFDIKMVKITSVRLAHVLDASKQATKPVYVFSGTTRGDDGRTYNVTYAVYASRE